MNLHRFWDYLIVRINDAIWRETRRSSLKDRRRITKRELQKHGLTRPERHAFKAYRKLVQPHPIWIRRYHRERKYFSLLEVTSKSHDFSKGCPDWVFKKRVDVTMVVTPPRPPTENVAVPRPVQMELLSEDSRTYHISPARILAQARQLKHLDLWDAIEQALDCHHGMIGRHRINVRSSIKWILDQEALPAKRLAAYIAKREERQRSHAGFYEELRRVNRVRTV